MSPFHFEVSICICCVYLFYHYYYCYYCCIFSVKCFISSLSINVVIESKRILYIRRISYRIYYTCIEYSMCGRYNFVYFDFFFFYLFLPTCFEISILIYLGCIISIPQPFLICILLSMTLTINVQYTRILILQYGKRFWKFDEKHEI